MLDRVRSLTPILKSNDLRGAVPELWGPDEAWGLGAAIAQSFNESPALLVGHDMRLSGVELAEALASGARTAGMNVIMLGQISTDTMYYASGAMDLPGAMLTASHNPAGDNGLKLVRPGAKPVSRDNGLRQIVEQAERCTPATLGTAFSGDITHKDVIPDFARFLRQTVDLASIRRLKVVVDAGNGMGGMVVDAVLGTAVGLPELALDLVRLYFEPDGTFPNHPADPLDPKNLEDLQRTVVESGADIGLAFDGDADRCFVVDQKGQVVPPSVIGQIIALREVALELAAGRPAVIVRNAITSQALAEAVEAAGGQTVRTRVGHGIIKPTMAKLDAVFGAEHSGHFYFRDFYYADSGILTALHILAALGTEELQLSDMVDQHSPYVSSGEINFPVADPVHSVQKVQQAYAAEAAQGAVTLDALDGLTVNHWSQQPRWWANVRPSNTEPLLRLNVEAEDPEVMSKVRDGIAGIVGEVS
jgi:phosphomannomutase